MNLPNKLTILRVIMIPFFVFFLLAPFFDGYGNYLSLQALQIWQTERLPENITL